MNEKQINIILADDEEVIHSGLKNMILEANKKASDYTLNLLAAFYNTEDLKDYLCNDDNIEPDLLLLDIDFKGGESGIEALEELRELAPRLEITLLSAIDEYKTISPAIKDYNVKYLNKPIKPDVLLLHIAEIEQLKSEFEKLKDDLKAYEEWINYTENDNETALPKNISDVISKMFKRLVFDKQAIKDLLACTDYKAYDVLKNVDMGYNTPGMYSKVIKTQKVKNYDKITEYRFSKKGRIFISSQGEKPIVVCIDPFHRVFA